MSNVDRPELFSRHRPVSYSGHTVFRPQETSTRQGKLATFLYRMPLRSLLTTVSFIGLSSNYALAADCGPGPVVVCNPTPGDVHADGITYIHPAGAIALTINNGFVINRTHHDEFDGVFVSDLNGQPLTVNLANNVTITASGFDADGVVLLQLIPRLT